MTLNFVGLIFLFVSGYFQGDFVVDSTFLNNGHESNLRIFRQNIKSDRNGSRVKIMTHSHDGNGVNEIRHLNMKYDPNPLAEDITTSTHRSRQQIDSNPNNGYTIEVLIVIDTSMQIFHTKKGSNVTEYVLSLMSMVIDMFAHTSIGSFIDVAVVGIEKNLVVEKDNDMLASFQNSMSNQTRKRNYDVGLLLTRENICEGCDEKVGRTIRGEMCSPKPYAVVYDYGPKCAITIAHELAHLLNAPHDWDVACSKFPYNEHMHIMGTKENKTWSTCSRHFIRQFLEDEKGSCLLNQPSNNMLERIKPENPKHTDGGWSDWKISGQCTRPCGGGVQWYARECNNPIPKTVYCIGRHTFYESCNTHDCPVAALDFREKQCIAMNNCTHNWTAHHNLYAKDQCKLVCWNIYKKEYRVLSGKVIDGTPCRQNSFDKCVIGICRPAGCDNKLNSKLKLNSCGVCYRNNKICQYYSQTYSAKQIIELNENRKYSGYYNVTKIPKGAVNVEIIRFGQYGDGNYLLFKQVQGIWKPVEGHSFIDQKNPEYFDDASTKSRFEYTTNKTIVKLATLPFKPLLDELNIKIFLSKSKKSNGDLIHYSYWIKSNDSSAYDKSDFYDTSIHSYFRHTLNETNNNNLADLTRFSHGLMVMMMITIMMI